MSQPGRSVVSWLLAAIVVAWAAPTKAPGVVTQGGPPPTLTALERAKAVAAGFRIPAPGETPVEIQARLTVLRQTTIVPHTRPVELRTMEPRP